MNGCEIIYYSTPEEEDFTLDIADFISKLSEDIDIIFISNLMVFNITDNRCRVFGIYSQDMRW